MCVHCGVIGTQQVVKEFYMIEYLTARGWNYTGTCGCTPKMDSYANATYPGIEFWLSAQHFNIKQRNGVGVVRTIASGTKDSIDPIYKQNINSNAA